MQDFKNKLYHYETPPPDEIWNHIVDGLDSEKVIEMHGHPKHKFLFYGVTAAASIVIIFLGSVFFKNNSNPGSTYNTPVEKENQLLAEKREDSINLNQQILKSIINNPKEKEEIVSKEPNHNSAAKKYLTVAGPEGQPVKISPKVATLIISADNEYPPKPVWSKEIRKWQKIMLSSTISTTSANFVDMVQLAANKENLDND
jgi:hypothetical protein